MRTSASSKHGAQLTVTPHSKRSHAKPRVTTPVRNTKAEPRRAGTSATETEASCRRGSWRAQTLTPSPWTARRGAAWWQSPGTTACRARGPRPGTAARAAPGACLRARSPLGGPRHAWRSQGKRAGAPEQAACAAQVLPHDPAALSAVPHPAPHAGVGSEPGLCYRRAARRRTPGPVGAASSRRGPLACCCELLERGGGQGADAGLGAAAARAHPAARRSRWGSCRARRAGAPARR